MWQIFFFPPAAARRRGAGGAATLRAPAAAGGGGRGRRAATAMAKATGRRSPRSTWLLALLALIALAAALAQRAAAQDEADFDFDDDSNDIGADAGSFSEEQGGEDEVQPQLLALMIGAHEGNVEGVREVRRARERESARGRCGLRTSPRAPTPTLAGSARCVHCY